jgi:UDP-N-acetylmuramoyl-tripeptide--D-alanyl-D-alanine ligase
MIRPDLVVVTSIGSEHNRSLPTLEATREEKSEMVRALSDSGIAILNGDDPNVLWMKSQTRARTITFGIDETNDISARSIALDWPNGTRFRLHADGETRDIRIRLLGKHMVYSTLAAIAVSLAEGLTLDQVIPKLEAMPPTPGRMQIIPVANAAFILRDDFKSPLETIDAALDVLSEIPAQRRIIILGDVEGPPEGKNKIYRQVGERIGKIASRAIFIGGDSCRNYSRGAKRIGLPSEEVTHIQGNVLKAAELLREEIRPGDVVLIKGRSTQRLDRVALSLMGRTVRCGISYCNVKVRCENCPMLERGWSGQKVPMWRGGDV